MNDINEREPIVMVTREILESKANLTTQENEKTLIKVLLPTGNKFCGKTSSFKPRWQSHARVANKSRNTMTLRGSNITQRREEPQK